MRYQERIYIQNSNSAVRNKDILNVNMSSDICIFQNPTFSLSGASKIDCSGTTSPQSYIISSNAETIPLKFDFTGNTDTFINTNASFKYVIYKYNELFDGFSSTPVFSSERIPYSAFSATNSTTEVIAASGLTLDGEYLVKGHYQFSACTDFLGKMGKGVDTENYLSGKEYGLYDKESDYYFIAMKAAESPIFSQNTSNDTPTNQLKQQVILPKNGQTQIVIASQIAGDFVLSLNGLVLAKNIDYSFSGNIVSLSGETMADDIITVIYTSGGGNSLVGDNINISTSIVSGATDGQGSNLVYYNTSTNKYEIYSSTTPAEFNTVIVMVNGVTLASGVDYYQSSTNAKRIILEGDLLVGDVITIVYFPKIGVINGLNTNNPFITWYLSNAPQKNDGFFTLEVSYDSNFLTPYYSGVTDYVVGESRYYQDFIASGSVGTQLFYRVKNEKNYTTICGDIINSTAYSEIIPITIQTNSINSY